MIGRVQQACAANCRMDLGCGAAAGKLQAMIGAVRGAPLWEGTGASEAAAAACLPAGGSLAAAVGT